MDRFLWRNSILASLFSLVILLSWPFDSVAQIKLAWDPNTDADLAGYRVYSGTASRTYGAPIDVGNVTICTVPGLTQGVTYYFSVTAYDSSNNESGYSNEVYGMLISTTFETVNPPNVLSGPTSGVTGSSSTYTAGGSTSSLGHPVEYQFDWRGNGSDLSLWGSATQSKTWTAAGTYNIRAKARCAQDTSVVSGWTSGLSVTISAPSGTVSTPSSPIGPASGAPNTSYTYSTGGSSSNLGQSVQYFFDWGDGTNSGWLAVGTTGASKSWSSLGTYNVRAKARCSMDTTIESDWSRTLTVSVSQNDLPDLTGQWTSFAEICRDIRYGKKCRISGKLTIQNIGTLSAPFSFVRFCLSNDGQYKKGTDTFLKQVATGTIKAGKSETKAFSYSFTLGKTASGKYIIAVMDANNRVAESNENNNYVVFGPIP